MVNERIPGWTAILIIVLTTSLLYYGNALTENQTTVITLALLFVAFSYRIYAWQYARCIVIERRKLLKQLWTTPPEEITYYEEQMVVLLGKIKSALPVTLLCAILVGFLIVYRDGLTKSLLFALGFTIGLLFLAARLHFQAHAIGKVLLPDDKGPLPLPATELGTAKNLYIEIDRHKFHDFILPEAALPFWSMRQAERWLTKFGFTRISPRTWQSSIDALRHLEEDEILAIRTTKMPLEDA